MNLFPFVVAFFVCMVIYSVSALEPPKEMVPLLGFLAQGWLMMVKEMIKMLVREREMFNLIVQVKGKLT